MRWEEPIDYHKCPPALSTFAPSWDGEAAGERTGPGGRMPLPGNNLGHGEPHGASRGFPAGKQNHGRKVHNGQCTEFVFGYAIDPHAALRMKYLNEVLASLSREF